jgi:uncharacterized protein (DUF362 family)
MEEKTVYLLHHEPAAPSDSAAFRIAGHALIAALKRSWRAPVVIKPNVLLSFGPDSGILTHPAFVGGMVDALLASGLSPKEIVVAEGGGTEEGKQDMNEIFAANGYTAELAPRGVELRDLNRDRYVVLDDPQRRVLHHLYASRTILEAGTLLNVAKMKAHNFATVTLSIKNMQGMLTPIQHRHLCTPYPRCEGDDGIGLDLHILDKPGRFYHKLVDLTTAFHPDLHIIEGIVGRDGTGFNRGKNIPLGIALAGDSPFAVDYVGASLMGFDPQSVGFLRAAAARGLWTFAADQVRVLEITANGICPCPDWMHYRAEPPFELIKRDDVLYDEGEI